MGRAVPVRRLDRIAHLPAFGPREPLARHRRARHISRQALELVALGSLRRPPACSECVLRSAASASRAPLRSARPRARGFVDAAAEPIDYLEEAVARIEKAASLIRIAELCETVGVSKRHLSRTFADVVGVGPKYFAKVIQLNAALGALLGGDEGEISRVAHALGYTDQAHFVHLMQELLRMPPTAFLESDDDVLTTFVAKSQVDRTT